MTKMKYFFIAILLLCTRGVEVYAQEFSSYSSTTEIFYSVVNSEDKTVKVISSPKKYSGDLVIPQCVTYNGVTYSVTSIGAHAFSNCSGLTSVEIPNSVTSIGEYAFLGCGLTTVEIPSNVTNIAWGTFQGCELASVVIHNGVKSIGDGAFNSCHDLTSVEIPESVTSIGAFAFYACGLTSLVIPNGVKSIGNEAFYYCNDLTSVEIPESVTSIGEAAFCGWNFSLTSIVVDEGNMVYDSRENCNAIIESESNTLVIGCQSTTIPNSVTSIGNRAFEYNFGDIPTIEIPNSVTTIGERAFYGSQNFHSIKIPSSVSYIGKEAFADCHDFTSIVVDAGNLVYDSREDCNAIIESESNTLIVGCESTKIPESVTSIGDYAFSQCYLRSVEIPNSVTSIGEKAFFYCRFLNSVVIPNSVTSIGDGAFHWCDELNNITCLNQIPPQNYDAFDNYNATLYVPYGAKSAYSTAEYWKNFENIEELDQSHYELKDADEYADDSNKFCDSITYTRTLPNLYWNALYVPFELPYDVISDRYDVAYINDVNGYDTDDNGEIDDLAMEIIKIKGGTLKANHPYLIKAKTEADKDVNITVENTTLYAAEENAVDCSSVYQNYVVKGTYTKKTAEELAGKLAISTSGAWQPLAEGTALNPFRLYLSIENRDNSPLKVETIALSRMRIIERGETTGIEDIAPAQQRETVIFDLSGRRVKQPVKGGVYIVNGKKMIF